jgi:hypothetical protein
LNGTFAWSRTPAGLLDPQRAGPDPPQGAAAEAAAPPLFMRQKLGLAVRGDVEAEVTFAAQDGTAAHESVGRAQNILRVERTEDCGSFVGIDGDAIIQIVSLT